jgi:hypothetical protein
LPSGIFHPQICTQDLSECWVPHPFYISSLSYKYMSNGGNYKAYLPRPAVNANLSGTNSPQYTAVTHCIVITQFLIIFPFIFGTKTKN